MREIICKGLAAQATCGGAKRSLFVRKGSNSWSPTLQSPQRRKPVVTTPRSKSRFLGAPVVGDPDIATYAKDGAPGIAYPAILRLRDRSYRKPIE